MGALLGVASVDVAAAAPANGERCQINTDHGLRGALEGVIVDGVCQPVTQVQRGGPQVMSRTVGCMAAGAAIVDGSPADDSCGPNVPRCMLLVDGGQTSPYPIVAYADQVRGPGARSWTVLRFWCPQSTAPVAVPGAADIRDRVIRLLPRVPAGTTGPTTLVNIQTVLWADTPQRRSLGRVMVVGQPVWLRLAFDHAVWDFGDGSGTSSQVPGKVYDATGDPCRTVSCPDYFGHTFTRTGVMTVSVRVAWRASYSLDGQHFQPVDDTPLTGPASTVRIHVRQARGVLVATGN